VIYASDSRPPGAGDKIVSFPEGTVGARSFSQDEVHQIVAEILISEFEVDPDNLSPDAKLGEDLELDSLDGVDLVVALEKAFSTRIPEGEARQIRTLSDIYAQVERRLAADQVEV